MKRIKYLLSFAVVSIFFISGYGYSQDGNADRPADDGPVTEKKIESKSEEPGNSGEVTEPVYKQEEGESVIKEYPTERVKTKTEQPTEEEVKNEAGYGSETETVKTNTESTDVEVIKRREKERQDSYYEEKGKSESRGNKDKNNDSPYDHDQGKGNDWKVDGNSDTQINNKDKKHDDKSVLDGVKKETKSTKSNKKNNKKNK